MNDVLNVVCWKWKDPRWQSAYSSAQVNTLASMVSRNLKRPHRITCVTDDPSGIDLDIGIVPLWPDLAEMGHCYRRLKAFSKQSLELFGEQFLSLDLDSVIIGELDSLLPEFGSDLPEFKIARDTQPPTPYNGSMFYIRGASRSRVWDEFDPKTSPAKGRALGYCACDQAWIAACLGPNEPTWGSKDGVYSFKNEIVPKFGGTPPKDGRIVFFHGNPKPWDVSTQSRHEWIRDAYKDTRKRIVILGGASCVWDDLARYKPPADCKVMVINDMGMKYQGRVDYWVTLHPEKLWKWQPGREAPLNQDYETIAYRKVDNARVDAVSGDWGGSSGLYAIKVALEKGFDHVVLCGVPMDNQPNIFRPNEAEWKEFKAFRYGWESRLDDIRGKAFSMSGWTREKLNP